jgi:predicted TIM-barrel fold metal-dependent hydrolase
MNFCQGPEPVTRSPNFALPKNSTDCHLHVCGPEKKYPYIPERIYTPPDALLSVYTTLMNTLCLERAVLVQPSVYGTDNQLLLDTLATNPSKYRGVAVVKENITDHEIEKMHLAGVRGLRCNIVDLADNKGVLPLPSLNLLAEKIKSYGWHIELLMHVNEFPDFANAFKNFSVPIVLGHYGYQKTSIDIKNKGFQNLLALMREGKAWVKLTGLYRISESGYPFADVERLAVTLIEANPNQLVWGSDWPHVMVKNKIPNDTDMLNIVGSWVKDKRLRQKIFVTNPKDLYDF